MLIAICDDDKEIAEKIFLLCRECVGDTSEIVIFRDGNKLLEYSEDIDLIILDIEMPKSNGIEIKNKIQNINEKALIIFVTNHREFVMDAFGINVLGFIIKNELKIQLPMMLKTASELLDKFVLIDELFDSREILYIKSEHNYGKLVLTNEKTYMVRSSMRQLEDKLIPYDFLRIHREYIVNMRWIESFYEDKIKISGKKLPVSTRLRGTVKKKYKEFCKKNARYC